jgi:tetratricopeptide (TPR) repeat protein
MGVLLSFTGEFDAAEKEFERALALDPNLPDTHAGFAVLKLNMEDYAAALLATRRALELSRTYESALYSVYEMFALIGLGRLEEAWTITKKGLDRHPDTGSLLMGLVALAEALNLPREMEAARAKLLEVSPEIRTSGTTPAWLCGKKVREWFVTHMTAAGLL